MHRVLRQTLTKKMKIILSAVLALSVILAGCATQSGDSSAQAKQKPAEKNPEVGMTKDQVVQMFGKTDNRTVTSEGETWIYHLNMGEMFIPFNFGYRPKTRIINFGSDGLVKSWAYNK